MIVWTTIWCKTDNPYIRLVVRKNPPKLQSLTMSNQIDCDICTCMCPGHDSKLLPVYGDCIVQGKDSKLLPFVNIHLLMLKQKSKKIAIVLTIWAKRVHYFHRKISFSLFTN